MPPAWIGIPMCWQSGVARSSIWWASPPRRRIAAAGVPFERGSARPLEFGHWAAHKLEQLSDFRVSHGEAVAVGMAIDVIYARRTGLLPEPIADRILEVIRRLGFELFAPVK